MQKAIYAVKKEFSIIFLIFRKIALEYLIERVVTNLSAVIISAIVFVSIICAYFVLDKKKQFFKSKKVIDKKMYIVKNFKV